MSEASRAILLYLLILAIALLMGFVVAMASYFLLGPVLGGQMKHLPGGSFLAGLWMGWRFPAAGMPKWMRMSLGGLWGIGGWMLATLLM